MTTESTSGESNVSENTITENDASESTTTTTTTTTTTLESDTTERDPITEVAKFLDDFDYQVEIFDWENFEEDISYVEEMDFSGHV